MIIMIIIMMIMMMMIIIVIMIIMIIIIIIIIIVIIIMIIIVSITRSHFAQITMGLIIARKCLRSDPGPWALSGQVHPDLPPEPPDLELAAPSFPGVGCPECRQWFLDQEMLDYHRASKAHKACVKHLEWFRTHHQ